MNDSLSLSLWQHWGLSSLKQIMLIHLEPPPTLPSPEPESVFIAWTRLQGFVKQCHSVCQHYPFEIYLPNIPSERNKASSGSRFCVFEQRRCCFEWIKLRGLKGTSALRSLMVYSGVNDKSSTHDKEINLKTFCLSIYEQIWIKHITCYLCLYLWPCLHAGWSRARITLSRPDSLTSHKPKCYEYVFSCFILSALVWFSVYSKHVMSCCGKASVIYNPITPIRSKLMGFQTPGSKHTTTRQFQSAAYFTLFYWIKQQTIQMLI